MAAETYYSVRTANSAYYVRFTHGQHDWRYAQRPDELTVYGAGRVFDIDRLPDPGMPMYGTDANGRLRTSPVRSVQRISRKRFLAEA
jgi:hypothetical protein